MHKGVKTAACIETLLASHNSRDLPTQFQQGFNPPVIFYL